VRLRRRAAGLVVGAILLFLVGTNVQSGWLLVLSALVLGAALSGLVLPWFVVRGITAHRRAPAEAFVGDEVRVDLVVTNTTRRSKLWVLVRDSHIAPASAFVPGLGSRASVASTTVRRASRRGVVDGGALQVVSSAPFGVAEARRSVAAGGRTVVYPRVVPVTSFSLLDAGWKSGEEAPRVAGRGLGQEFLGVREDQRGDSLRHVHWPSTARHGSLIVREFEQERRGWLVVIVDSWADAGEAETALDLCCSVAGSVALAALASGRSVSFAAARDGELLPPLELGRTEALTWLAELRAPGGLSFPAAVEAAAPMLRPPATCLLVFPTWRPNTGRSMARAVAALGAAGVPVAAVVVDASGLRSRVPVLTPAEAEELRAGLVRAGADAYPVHPEEDLAACLARSPSAAG